MKLRIALTVVVFALAACQGADPPARDAGAAPGGDAEAALDAAAAEAGAAAEDAGAEAEDAADATVDAAEDLAD